MNTSNGSTYLPAKPIESRDDDILGRASFAKDLAKTIKNWGGDDSLIISLNGTWGAGKSSLINMVEESLLKDEKYPKDLIVKFNPWEWSEQNKITEKLFIAIENAIESRIKFDSSSKKKNLLKKFRKYQVVLGVVGVSAKALKSSIDISVDALSLFLLLTGYQFEWNWMLIAAIALIAVRFLASLSIHFEQLLEKLFQYFREKVGDIEEIRKNISESLKEEFNESIIVIIDDIDRLSKEEIQNLFQIVKANANFPKIVYVLLFDNDIVINALEEVAPDKGDKFLDKIIQVQLDLPAIDDFEVKEILKDELNKISFKITGKDIDHEISNWEEVFSKGIAPYFKTIRDVYRFVNSFSFHANLFKKGSIYDINLVDLLCVEVFRLHEADVYRKLYTSKSLLFPQYNDQIELYFDMGLIPEKEPKSFIEEFHETHDEIIKNTASVKAILRFLFPNHQEDAPIAARANDYTGYKELLGDNRLAHRLNFDNYFKFKTNQHGFSKTDFVELLNSKDDVLEKLVNEEFAKDRFKQLVERFESHIDLISIDKNALFIEIIMIKIDKALNDSRTYNAYLNTYQRFKSAIEELITLSNDPSNTLKLISNLLDSKEALYVPVSLVDDFELKISEQSTGKKLAEVYEPVRDEIKRLAVARIKKSAKDSTLSEHLIFFNFLIGKWQKWKGVEEVEKWIEELLSTKEGVLTFLEGMWSYDPDGNYHDIDEIEIYTNPSKMLENVKSYIESVKTEYESKILRSYIESFEKQRPSSQQSF